MAIFSYNGVYFPYPLHTDFRQEFLLDDTGQTDLVYSKYDLTIQSIIRQDYLPTLAPEVNTQASNPADIMAYVRQKLKKPRKALTVTFNNLNLLPTVQDGNEGTVDAKNGPMPQHVNIISLTNASFLITFRVIAHYWENPALTPNGVVLVGRNQPGDAILYNRWTETQAIDRYLTSTYTREGKFLIRTDNIDGQTADWYREKMCTLGVLSGFNRIESNYTVSPDGLGIQYRIQDREYFRAYPFPAYEARGSFMEHGDNGPRRVLEARVVLKGAPSTDQVRLMATAIIIAKQKINLRVQAIAQGNVAPIIRAISMQPEMWDNTVGCNVQAQVNAKKGDLSGVGTYQGLQDLVSVPGIDSPVRGVSLWPNGHPSFPLRGDLRNGPDVTTRDASKFLLQAAAYYDPSLRNHIMTANGQVQPTGLLIGQAGKIQEAN